MLRWNFLVAFAPCIFLAQPQRALSEEYVVRVSMIGYANVGSASNLPKTRLLRSVETIVREGELFFAKWSDTDGDQVLVVHGKIDRITDVGIDGEVRVTDRHYIGIDQRSKDGKTKKMYDGTGSGFRGGRIPVLLGKPYKLHSGTSTSHEWYLELLLTKFDQSNLSMR